MAARRHPRHREICAVLRRHGIVVMRSDTVYGLHGVAPDTGGRIAAMKGRSAAKPLLVLVADAAAAAAVTGTAPPPALAALWPGPLTIVLPVRVRDGSPFAGVTATLGVRVPADPELRAIVAEVGAPVYSTSANRAGEPPLNDRAALQRAFGDVADLVVYDGPPIAAQPSTVVDASVAPPRVVRAGAISLSASQLHGNS